MRPMCVVGSLSLDVVGGGAPRVGGGAYYAARALRALGVPARIVTRCADADAGALLPRLRRLGVPVEARAGRVTWAFAIEYADGVRRMRVDAVGDPWTPADVRGWVEEAIAGARWVHLAPLGRGDFAPGTVEALARRGRLISYDGQGLVRLRRTGELRLAGELDPGVLASLRVLKLADDEAAVVLRSLAPEHVATLGVPEVLVTLGARGSLLFAAGRGERVPAHAVDADPTGAGDMFATGYVAARNGGAPPLEAARRATRLVERLLSERVREA
ncbi:MAG: carbohydrate kinase [Thermoleophilia bacterium]|nr:carbohydrate kinase [Thermoleophilia bacterium]